MLRRAKIGLVGATLLALVAATGFLAPSARPTDRARAGGPPASVPDLQRSALTPKAPCARVRLGVVFVVDDSGSNVEEPTDPHYLRAAAVRVALSYLPAGTVVAAERFADNAEQIFSPRELTDANRAPLSTAVRRSLQSSGSTDYDAAFIEANVLLQHIRGVDKKVVIFLSDGLPSYSYSADQEIAAQHIPIYAVGYGQASQDELEGIARRSGGKSFQIGTVSDAVSRFAQIVNPLICNQPKVDVGVRLRAGEKRTIKFYVPKNTPGFSALVTWDAGNPKITVRRPNGSALVPGPSVRIDRSTPNAFRADVTSPVAGTWSLVLVADRTTTISVHFNLWTTSGPQPSGGCSKSLSAGPATLTATCWQRVSKDRFRATGDVRINGILLAGSGAIDLDLAALRLSAGVRTWLVNGVPLATGRLSIRLDQPFQVGATGSLHGLRLTGQVTIQLAKGSSTAVTAHLALPIPGHAVDLSGDVQFTVDTRGAANLNRLHVKGEGEVPFGGFRLKDVELDYIPAADTWRGAATIVLETLRVEASGSVSFRSGAFTGASAAAKGRVPLGAGFFLDGVRVQIELSPKAHLLGGATISFGPKSLLKGDIALQFWPLYLWQVDGTVDVADELLRPIGAHARVHGTVAVHTERGVQADIGGTLDVGLNQPPLGVRGFVQGYIAASAFNIEGTTSTSFGPAVLETRAVVSSKGIAGCATTKLNIGFVTTTQPVFGFRYRWGDALPYIGGCDVDNFRVAKPSLLGLFDTGEESVSTFQVPANRPFEMFTVESGSGDPNVVVRGPGGETFDSRAGAVVDQQDVFVLHYPAIHRTFVAVAKPRAGTWQVEPVAGSPPPAQVTAADGLRPLAIRAVVGGKGTRRFLRYKVGPLHGRTLSFFQSRGSAPGALPILRRAKRSGVVRFRPERGLAARRFVTAVVSEEGVAVETRTVASYRIAVPQAPGRVSAFVVTRGRRLLAVHWGSAPRAVQWRIQVQSSDGRRFIRTLRLSRRHFELRVRAGAKVFVQVRGVDRFGRVGLPASRISVYRPTR
jgi:von Willebrand factor type A domain